MNATKKPINANGARHQRLCAARLKYIAEDAPDVCATATLLSRATVNSKKGARSSSSAWDDFYEGTLYA